MAGKFQNKYRIASARLQNWDYRWSGAYFITICTAGREHYFGEIDNGKMKLSNLGVIADIFWHEIPARKPFVKLGEYVIMPNHLHGILIIDEPPKNSGAVDANGNSKIGGVSQIDNRLDDDRLDDPLHIVETLHATSLQYATNDNIPTNDNTPTNENTPTNDNVPTNPSYKSNSSESDDLNPTDPKSPSGKNETMSKKSPKSNSISTIIRSYKSAVTKHANRLGIPNGWQTRFHDHIIRDDAAFERISNYIKNNPANWQDDKFFNE